MAAAWRRTPTGRACCARGRRDALRRLHRIRGPAASSCRCCRRSRPAPTVGTVRDQGARRLDRLPGRCDRRRRPAFDVRPGGQPREPARRDDAAGAQPAVRARRCSAPAHRCPRAGPDVAGTSVLVPGGPFVLGVDAVDEPHSLDNERPRPRRGRARLPDRPGAGHQRASGAAFIADGGYREPRWWSDRGWEHRRTPASSPPQFWGADGTRTRFGHVEHVPADEPVQHVTYFEARGLRRVGGRPAAHRGGVGEGLRAGIPSPVARRRFPWGASEPTGTGQPRRGRAAARAGRRLPGGRVGVRRRADARRRVGVDLLAAAAVARASRRCSTTQYSAPFFERRLQGAARRFVGGRRRGILRPSFRNWDHPIRRQIFCRAAPGLAWDG